MGISELDLIGRSLPADAWIFPNRPLSAVRAVLLALLVSRQPDEDRPFEPKYS